MFNLTSNNDNNLYHNKQVIALVERLRQTAYHWEVQGSVTANIKTFFFMINTPMACLLLVRLQTPTVGRETSIQTNRRKTILYSCV